MMSALLVRSPWIDYILSGSKSWEMRGSSTTKRGQIALIQSGTGTVIGVADLLDTNGSLDFEEYVKNAEKIGLDSRAAHTLPYRRTFAWILANAKRLHEPVPYSHPNGAIIWVKLDPAVERFVRRQL